MTGKEFGVAVLGAGRIGMLHAENLMAAVPGLTLKVVADPVPEAVGTARERLDVKGEEDWRVAVQDPDVDAVIICSPTEQHAEQIREAAAAGKHIFCEKPIDRDLASIDELLEYVEEQGVKFQTGFNRRFDRNFAALRKRTVEGEVGDLWILKITSRDPELPPPSYLQVSGGLFFDMAIHDFDMARFLADDEIREVTACGSALVSEGTKEAGDIDTALTTVRFENEVLAQIDNCRQTTYGYDQRVEILGRDGMLMADNERLDTVTFADSSGFHRQTLPHFFLERYRNSYARELEQFRDALEGAPVAVSGFDGRQAVLAAVAADRSLRERRTVALEEVEQDLKDGTMARRGDE
jgi:myo-inositol 2-dehydrogenase/D-chiro-inositol 1-dehydrogenase